MKQLMLLGMWILGTTQITSVQENHVGTDSFLSAVGGDACRAVVISVLRSGVLANSNVKWNLCWFESKDNEWSTRRR
jgi:hypothetical protein